MKIKVYAKEVYGSTLFYIADEKQAKTIESLTGRKTVRCSDFKHWKSLGFEIEQVIMNNGKIICSLGNF